jgi:Mn2+/Fe2+ NRAMP family transporter
MAEVQFICTKVGMVSGQGLAGVLREHYPRWLLYPAVIVLVVAKTLNVDDRPDLSGYSWS